MKNKDYRNEYFKYLLSNIDIDPDAGVPDSLTYFNLLKRLHKKVFTWVIDLDKNRAKDGEYLRNEFAKEFGYDTANDFIEVTNAVICDTPCTCLEMFIALSQKTADIMWKSDDEIGAKKWFFIFMENLGLDKFNDEYYYKQKNCYIDIDNILNRFLERTYQKNGVGGLFAFKQFPKDLRKIEIWYQLNLWLNYNYRIPISGVFNAEKD